MMTKDNITNEEELFSFINPKENICLSKLKGIDLQHLLLLINDYKLELRDSLNLSPDITFGLELEFEHANRKKIDKKFKLYFPNKEWEIDQDGSLRNGAEIRSPVLKDTKITWLNLEKVCSIVAPYAKIGENTGGHIHIGSQILGENPESWFNLMKTWGTYENVIYRFLYGEFLIYRPSLTEYAIPLYMDFQDEYKNAKENNLRLSELIHSLSFERNQAINFGNVDSFNLDDFLINNTIEFRCPNGTLDPVIWQNNVNFLTKFLLSCGNNNFNNEIIENRLKLNKYKFYAFDWKQWYSEIHLEQSLELCDMMFDNNLDKMYFLKQYLKQLQVCKDNKRYTKGPTLTKVKK